MIQNVKKLDVIDHDNICSYCGKNSLVTDYVTKERWCSKCSKVKKEELIEHSGNAGHGGSNGAGGGGKVVKLPINLENLNKPKVLKSLNIARIEIARLCQVLGSSKNLQQRGITIFEKGQKQKIVFKNTKCFSAACLYAACRETGVIRTIKDFTKNSDCKTTRLRADYRKIIEILKIKPKIMSPIKYISRIGSNTIPPISVIIQQKAIKRLEKLDGMEGKDPVGIAAAALCWECRLKNTKHTLKSIALAADVNAVTVRNRMKDIKKFYNDQ